MSDGKIHLKWHDQGWCTSFGLKEKDVTLDLTQVTCLHCLNARVGHLRNSQGYIGKWRDNPINVQRASEQASILHAAMETSVWNRTTWGKGKFALCTNAYAGCKTSKDINEITCKWCLASLEGELKYYCRACRKPMIEIFGKGARNPTTGDEGYCKNNDRCQLAKAIKDFKKIKKKIKGLADKIKFEAKKVDLPTNSHPAMIVPAPPPIIKETDEFPEIMGYLPKYHLDV